MKKNECFEIMSCFLLALMTVLSCTYQDSIKAGLTLFSGIMIFCIMTYFSNLDKSISFGLIKCECMFYCLLMMLIVLYDIHLTMLLIFTFFILLTTLYRKIIKNI